MKTKPAKSSIQLLKQTVAEFSEDRVLRHSAALAYYAIFSLGPLLVLVVGVAGLIMGEENVRRQVNEQLAGMFGADSAKMVQSMMDARRERGSLLATVIGGVALVFGASGVFGQLQDSLNTIWEVKSKPGQGIMGFVRQRFLSMAMVVGIGFLLLISMVLTIVLNTFAGYLGGLVGLSETVAHVFNFCLSLALITVLFASIFKVLPDVEIRWKDVWVGAFGTALLFTLGKYLLGLYLGREGATSAYGAGAAFIVIILYIYYSALILFFGAEFTQVFAHARGAVIKPSEHAVPVTENERAQQGQPRRGAQGGKPRPIQDPAGPGYSPAMGAASAESLEFYGEPLAPWQQIRAQPWSFVLLVAGAGLAAGAFLKVKTLRKALGLYLSVRRYL